MTMTRSAAVSRRAIEPGPGPGLRTAAHSCAPALSPLASAHFRDAVKRVYRGFHAEGTNGRKQSWDGGDET